MTDELMYKYAARIIQIAAAIEESTSKLYGGNKGKTKVLLIEMIDTCQEAILQFKN